MVPGPPSSGWRLGASLFPKHPFLLLRKKPPQPQACVHSFRSKQLSSPSCGKIHPGALSGDGVAQALAVGGSFPVSAISGLEGLQEALGGGFLWVYF